MALMLDKNKLFAKNTINKKLVFETTFVLFIHSEKYSETIGFITCLRHFNLIFY